MAGISRYEAAALGLTAAFVFFTAEETAVLWLCWTVTV